MLASLNPILERVELGRHPFRVSDSLELETPVPRLPTDVGEAKETERLRLAKATRGSPLGSESAELDQACLLGVEFQVELREPGATSCRRFAAPHHHRTSASSLTDGAVRRGRRRSVPTRLTGPCSRSRWRPPASVRCPPMELRSLAGGCHSLPSRDAGPTICFRGTAGFGTGPVASLFGVLQLEA